MARDRLHATRGEPPYQQQSSFSYPQSSQEERWGRPSLDPSAVDPYSTDPLSGAPDPRRTSNSSSSRRRSSSRQRPSNPPPPPPPPTTSWRNPPPVVFGRAFGGHEDLEVRDFNPNMNSQYVPAPPAATRQRSISVAGQRVSEDRERQPVSPRDPFPPPQQSYYQQPYSRDRLPSAALPAPPYQQPPDSYDPRHTDDPVSFYEASEKASTVDFVERGSGQSFVVASPGAGTRNGSSAAGSAGRKRKGGPTIKAGDVPNEEMGQFFTEVSELQQALRQSTEDVREIQSLHLRLLSLPSVEDPQAVMVSDRLSKMNAETRALFASIKDRILALEQGNANLGALIPVGQSVHNLTLADVGVRTTQVSALKERFMAAVQAFAEVERDSRAKTTARIERQVKVVNPQMSPQEIAEVVRQAGTDGGNLFSQAVLSSGLRGRAARGALREVESRAADLARIEQTLTELAQLFNDMALLVEAQDVQVVAVEKNAVQASKDMEVGVKEVKQAVVHARSARKMRWWLLGIVLLLLVIIAVVVVVEVVVPLVKKNQNANGTKTQTTTSVLQTTSTHDVTSVFTSTAVLTSTAVITSTALAVAASAPSAALA